MEILLITASILFIFTVFKNLLLTARVLRKSGFRLALFFPNLRIIRQSFSYYLLVILKLAGLAGYIPVALNENLSGFYHFYVTFVLIADFAVFIEDLQENSWNMLRLSPRELATFIPSFLFICILYTAPLTDIYFWLLLLNWFCGLVYLFFALAFSFPAEILEDMRIEQAKRLLNKKNSLTMIVIYGKESEVTADILRQLIAEKYKTVKMDLPVQKAYHAAQYILKNLLNTDPQVIIVDIKPLQVNDAAEIGRLLKPEIGVFSGAAGSEISGLPAEYEDICYELISVMPQKGTCIVQEEHSATGSFMKKLTRVAKKKSLSLKLAGNEYFKEIKQKSSVFKVEVNGKMQRTPASLLGEDNIECLVQALFTARKLGVEIETLKNNFQTLKPLAGHMVSYRTPRGANILDCSAVKTGKSMINATRYAQLYPGQKIAVVSFTGIPASGRLHTISEVVKYMAVSYDRVIFLENSLYRKALKDNRSRKEAVCEFHYIKPALIPECILDLIKDRSDIAVFIGEKTAILMERVTLKGLASSHN